MRRAFFIGACCLPEPSNKPSSKQCWVISPGNIFALDAGPSAPIMATPRLVTIGIVDALNSHTKRVGVAGLGQTFPSQIILVTDTSMARATTYTVTLFWHPPAIMFRSSLLRRYLDRTILPEHFQVGSPMSRTLHPKNFSTNRIKQLARYGATVGQRIEPTRCSQHPFDTPQ